MCCFDSAEQPYGSGSDLWHSLQILRSAASTIPPIGINTSIVAHRSIPSVDHLSYCRYVMGILSGSRFERGLLRKRLPRVLAQSRPAPGCKPQYPAGAGGPPDEEAMRWNCV